MTSGGVLVSADSVGRVDVSECRHRFTTARVARLGTMGSQGPHLVPIVFAVEGDTVVTAVDQKAKRSRRLQRLANIAAHPAVALLVDEYDDDWSRLWWVRADGTARVIDDGTAMQPALDLLAERYEQYRQVRPIGPVIEIAVSKWSGWIAE